MQQTENQPLYWAKDRVPINLTLMLALVIAAWGAGAALGILPIGGSAELILVLGIAVAIYTWLFTPRQYLVYPHALCIAYGTPRVKTIHFKDIAVVEFSPLGLEQLRVRPVKGRRQSIRVRDPEEFCSHLEDALNAFRSEHPEFDAGSQPPESSAVAVVERQAPPAAEEAEELEQSGPSAETAQPETGQQAEGAGPEAEAADRPTGPASEDPPKRDEPPQEHRPIY